MYEPQVDDYVIWNRPNGDIEEGWVYFKGDKIPKKRGFNETPRYITIEIAVRDKPNCMYSSGKDMEHKKIHCLLLCYDTNWNELEYVKHRRTRAIQHYSQYDDINQEDKLAEKYKSTVSMYKSQLGRQPDY
jgi:hypothetical protein